MTIEQFSKQAHLPSDGLVPIRTVANLTGVNPVTLRAWERRYGLIRPVRTSKGHRLYTMTDVDLINQVVGLLENGMSIGQVGQVLTRGGLDESAAREEKAHDPWSGYQRHLVAAITHFDEQTLNEVYSEALSLYPVDIVTSRLIVPLLEELGWRWQTAQGSVAEEHFFSVFLRNKLGARLHHRSREPRGLRLLAACLPGEAHEVGILLFTLSAIDRDYRITLLGANMPLMELPPVVAKAGCSGIVLSGSAEVDPTAIRRDLPELREKAGVPVFIGGRITLAQGDALAAAGTIVLPDDFGLALRKIESVLKRGVKPEK